MTDAHVTEPIPHSWAPDPAHSNADHVGYRCSRCRFGMRVFGVTEKTTEVAIARALDVGARANDVPACNVVTRPPDFVAPAGGGPLEPYSEERHGAQYRRRAT